MPENKSVKDKIIVALDVDSESRAKEFVDLLYPTIKLFKIGSTLVLHCESLINYISNKGGRVFLDLKWYDIPNTVYYAVSRGTSVFSPSLPFTESSNIGQKVKRGVFMMTVHTQGSEKMLAMAAKGAKDKAQELNIEKPFVVGVTELTSESSEDVESIVLDRAKKAKKAGLDGVVCSAHEAAKIRNEIGKDFIIVTPGIRPIGSEVGDQQRVASPKDAIKSGADFIVVGRPIINAKDPVLAAKGILQEIEIL